MAITITQPIIPEGTYNIRAWKDNNLCFALTQGEGIITNDAGASVNTYTAKCIYLSLYNANTPINLNNANISAIHWAVKRPRGGGEDLVDCSLFYQSSNTIVIPIVKSLTEYAGELYGEVRVYANNSVTKFFGINAYVHEGVSDDAAEHSSQFTALETMINRVAQLTPEGTVDIETLKPSFVNLSYAHEVSSESYADGGVYVDDATDDRARYIYVNTSGTSIGLLRCATMPSAVNVNGVLQILETYSGGIYYRIGSGKSGSGTRTWDPAPRESGVPNWYSIEGTRNKDTSVLSDDDAHYPSSKLVKTMLAALSASTINYHYSAVASNPLTGVADNIPVPAIWNSNGTVYFLWGKTQSQSGTLYVYTGSVIPKVRVIDPYTEFDPSSTIGNGGDIVIGSSSNGVWFCKGGTQWIPIVVSYTKNEIDTKLSVKADSSSVYNKAAIDSMLSDKARYEWIDFDEDPSAIDDLSSDSTLYSISGTDELYDLLTMFSVDMLKQVQIKFVADGRVLSRYRTREESGSGLTEWSNYSDWAEAYVDNVALGTKQDVIKYERPRVVFSSIEEIPYSVGDLFYFNRKMYRYTGYTYAGSYYRANFTTDGVSAVTMASSPTSTETIANYGISTYNVGDFHVQIRSSDTKARNIYICTKVTSQASGTSLVYTYVWEELTVKADTISGYGITDAYTKSEIDAMLANLTN